MADAIERALCNGYRQWLSHSFSVRRTFSFRLVDDTVKRLDLTLPSGSFNARNGRKFETKRDPDRSWTLTELCAGNRSAVRSSELISKLFFFFLHFFFNVLAAFSSSLPNEGWNRGIFFFFFIESIIDESDYASLERVYRTHIFLFSWIRAVSSFFEWKI